VHFNITANTTAQWTSQQITEAFPYDSVPKYVIRDRDKIYGNSFVKRVRTMQIEEVLIPPKSPWQNPYCERVIGSIRRKCLDHCIILSEKSLVPHSQRLYGLLQQLQNSPFIEEELTCAKEC
jgi:putative transposase